MCCLLISELPRQCVNSSASNRWDVLSVLIDRESAITQSRCSLILPGRDRPGARPRFGQSYGPIRRPLEAASPVTLNWPHAVKRTICRAQRYADPVDETTPVNRVPRVKLPTPCRGNAATGERVAVVRGGVVHSRCCWARWSSGPKGLLRRGSAPTQRIRLTRSYPHVQRAYCQGLVYQDGFLYEGTGNYGESTLRKVELETGKVLQQHDSGTPACSARALRSGRIRLSS